jgi:hypothetical protein
MHLALTMLPGADHRAGPCALFVCSRQAARRGQMGRVPFPVRSVKCAWWRACATSLDMLLLNPYISPKHKPHRVVSVVCGDACDTKEKRLPPAGTCDLVRTACATEGLPWQRMCLDRSDMSCSAGDHLICAGHDSRLEGCGESLCPGRRRSPSGQPARAPGGAPGPQTTKKRAISNIFQNWRRARTTMRACCLFLNIVWNCFGLF